MDNPADACRNHDDRHAKRNRDGNSGREVPEFSELDQVHETEDARLEEVNEQRALTQVHCDKASDLT